MWFSTSERDMEVWRLYMPVVRFRLGTILVTVSVYNYTLQLFITGEETKGQETRVQIEGRDHLVV